MSKAHCHCAAWHGGIQGMTLLPSAATYTVCEQTGYTARISKVMEGKPRTSKLHQDFGEGIFNAMSLQYVSCTRICGLLTCADSGTTKNSVWPNACSAGYEGQTATELRLHFQLHQPQTRQPPEPSTLLESTSAIASCQS